MAAVIIMENSVLRYFLKAGAFDMASAISLQEINLGRYAGCASRLVRKGLLIQVGDAYYVDMERLRLKRRIESRIIFAVLAILAVLFVVMVLAFR